MLTQINLLIGLMLFISSSGLAGLKHEIEPTRSATIISGLREIPTVSFCELVSHPDAYERKTVRVRATFISNFESNLLFDPKCSGKKNMVWFMLDCETDATCDVLRQTLTSNLQGDPFSGEQGDFLFIGQLKFPKPGQRFGVQGGFRLGFSVSQIEQVDSVKPDSNRSLEDR